VRQAQTRFNSIEYEGNLRVNAMRHLRHYAATAAIVALVLGFGAESASAQGLFRSLFGGVSGGYNSKSYVVRFHEGYAPGTIVVSFGDRRLYFIHERGAAISYPIGVPSGKARWSGVSHVSRKRVDPPWTPTPDMRRENPKLPAHVPGGHPRNPLGVRAMYLGDTLYRIHGTDAPWTVGRDVTHGCIRLYNEHVIDLYKRTRVGARVIVTPRRFARY